MTLADDRPRTAGQRPSRRPTPERQGQPPSGALAQPLAPEAPGLARKRVRRPRPRTAAFDWQGVSLPRIGRLRAIAWAPTVLACALLVALVYLVETSGVATRGYDVQQLQSEQRDWQLQNDQLRLELAKRTSLAWVEDQAVTQLGMRMPDKVEYVTLNGAPVAQP